MTHVAEAVAAVAAVAAEMAAAAAPKYCFRATLGLMVHGMQLAERMVAAAKVPVVAAPPEVQKTATVTAAPVRPL